MGTEQESIARLETQFENLNKNFEEFKSESKDGRKDLSLKIDDLAKKLQEFSGYFNSLTAQQITINEISAWKNSVVPLINSLGDTKIRVIDIIWKCIQALSILGIGYLIAKFK